MIKYRLYSHINNKNGATSVLIILLLVVLMIFGLTILTTTLSNESLSNRKNEWLVEYYEMESEVALQLAQKDHDIQLIKENVVETKGDDWKSSFVTSLEENMSLYEEDGKYYFYLDVSGKASDYLKFITIQAEITMPLANTSKESFLSNDNYRIVLYSESQELFDYKDIEFGVPYAPDGD